MVKGKSGFWIVALFVLSSCMSTQHYPADGSAVLVKPTKRGWLKPDSTMDDENRAKKECGDELRSSEKLRKSSLTDWSDAYKACMKSKGFRYYKDR